MRKKLKVLTALLISSATAISMFGCGNAKTDEEKDNIAQKYGEKLNQVSKKQQDIKKKLVVAQNNLNKAEKEFADFRDKLWDI